MPHFMRYIVPPALVVLALSLAVPELPAQDRGVTVQGQDISLTTPYECQHALLIGASRYTNGWPALPGVERDIAEVHEALRKRGFVITEILDPGSDELTRVFREFISRTGTQTECGLVIYFAGHGHTIHQSYGDEMGYIVPVDAPNPGIDPQGFLERAVPMQQIEVYAKQIQSKHVLFLFDACFAGTIFTQQRSIPENISYKTGQPVRQFITSGSADEQVPDESVFRHQLVDGLEGGADLNRDGYVTGTELGEFLQERVINYTDGGQHPQYGKLRNPNLDKGDFVFAVSSAPPGPASPDGKTDEQATKGIRPVPEAAVAGPGIGFQGSNISGIGLLYRHQFSPRSAGHLTGGVLSMDGVTSWTIGAEYTYELARIEPFGFVIGPAAGFYAPRSGKPTHIRAGLGLGTDLRVSFRPTDSHLLFICRLYYPAWYSGSGNLSLGGAIGAMVVL